MKKQFFMRLLLVSVLGLMAASNVFASEADEKLAVFKLTAKPIDIDCQGKSTYQRPVWQRIVSLGVLASEHEVVENVKYPGVLGGVDTIRILLERNPDMTLAFARLLERVDPTIIKGTATCFSVNQQPLKFNYFRDENGEVIYEIVDDVSGKDVVRIAPAEYVPAVAASVDMAQRPYR